MGAGHFVDQAGPVVGGVTTAGSRRAPEGLDVLTGATVIDGGGNAWTP